jgi:hypothetical protein
MSWGFPRNQNGECQNISLVVLGFSIDGSMLAKNHRLVQKIYSALRYIGASKFWLRGCLRVGKGQKFLRATFFHLRGFWPIKKNYLPQIVSRCRPKIMNIWKKKCIRWNQYFCFSVTHGFLKWFDKEDIYDYDYLSCKKYTNDDTPSSH